MPGRCGPHGSACQDYGLLGCDVMFDRSLLDPKLFSFLLFVGLYSSMKNLGCKRNVKVSVRRGGPSAQLSTTLRYVAELRY